MPIITGIMIGPTGIGCRSCGDASFNAGIRLISSCCKLLISHPNVLNASDLNELPDNCLYVDGSSLDRFIEQELNLEKIKTLNKILMVVNSPINPININSKNASEWVLGSNIELVGLKTPLKMKAQFNEDGSAGGTYSGVNELAEQIKNYDYDALALQTPITADENIAEKYFLSNGENDVNPWGKIESIVSRVIQEKINKPVAHAPSESVDNYDNTYAKLIVKRSMAPEIISKVYTHCILKGLHRAPRLIFDKFVHNENIITSRDIDFLLTPHGCWGRPHIACAQQNIPIIVVKNDTTIYSNGFSYPKYKNLIFVENYLEAAGLLMCMNAGVNQEIINI